jgi:asparagine synthase (glutamine-hydrolysing)
VSGLFGYLSPEPPRPVLELAQAIGQRLVHRPWQRLETAAPDPRVGLGRLASGVFNPAPQPVRSADGQIALWLCGELYHQAARRAALVRSGALPPDADDAALALAIYQAGGPTGLTGLNGAFVLAVWDARRDELVLVNDRFGLYPHYWARVGGAFVFGPEIRALLAAPGLPRRLDRTALAEYLRFQHFLADHTWLQDVRLLPRAALLRYRPASGALEIGRYWDWDAIKLQPGVSREEAIEESANRFQRAVEARVDRQHRLGVQLSGGLDGRMILGFARRSVPLTTLTYGQPNSRDVVYAAELARRAGSRHHWFPFWDGDWVRQYEPLHLALTEGMQAWYHAHGINLVDQAHAQIDVSLSGFEGIVFLGFHKDRSWYAADDEADLSRMVFDGFCRGNSWPGLTEAEAETLHTGRGDRGLRGLAFESLRAALRASRHYPPDRRVDYFRLDHYTLRMLTPMLVVGRAGFEVRCPFWDYDFVDFRFSLPERLRTDPSIRREVLTRRMPDLALVPYDRDERLPHSNPLLYHGSATLARARHWLFRHGLRPLAARPRLYADYETWLRTDLRAWSAGILFDARTLDRGLVDPDGLRGLWQRHQRGDELWTIGKFAHLITAERALRRLLDEAD